MAENSIDSFEREWSREHDEAGEFDSSGRNHPTPQRVGATNRLGLFLNAELESGYILDLAIGRLWWVIYTNFVYIAIFLRICNIFLTVDVGGERNGILVVVCLLGCGCFATIAVVVYLSCIRQPLTETVALRAERLVRITLLISLIITALESLVWNACEADYNRLSHTSYYLDCQYKLFGWCGMQAGIPLMMLKVRGIVTIVNAMINFVCAATFALTVREKDRTDFGGTIIVRLTVFLGTLVFVVVVALAYDRFRRKSYLKQQAMLKQGQEAAALEKQVQKTLTSLVPQETISRVLNKEPVIDSNTKCCVGVFQIYDYATWSTTRLPHECVEVVDSLFTTFDRILTATKASQTRIEKVLMTGDIFVFSLGLRTHGKRNVEPVTDASAMLHFSLKCIRRARAVEGFGLHVAAGVSAGPCVAALFGTRYLRYNLLGAAFDQAMALSRHAAEPMTLTVCEAAKQLLTDPPQFLLQPLDPEITGFIAGTVWLVSFLPKHSPQSSPQSSSQFPLFQPQILTVPSDPSAVEETHHEVPKQPGGRMSFDSIGNSIMTGSGVSGEEAALLERERNLLLRDQFLSAMAGSGADASVGDQRRSELADDEAGLEPREKRLLFKSFILDFTCPTLESRYWEYCNKTAASAVYCDFTFTFTMQVVGKSWLMTHEGSATIVSLSICVFIGLLSTFRFLMWKLQVLPPNRAALYFVPAVVLQTWGNVSLLYATNGPSMAWPTGHLLMHMEFLNVMAAHNVPTRWSILCNFFSLCVVLIPMIVQGDIEFLVMTIVVGFFFMIVAGLPLVGMESDRRRDFRSRVLTQRLAATAESHIAAHKEILQMVLPGFVVAEAIKKLNYVDHQRCVVKEVSDMAILSLRLETRSDAMTPAFAAVDCDGALKLYGAVELALSGTNNLVLVQAVGSQLLIAGPMVETAVDEKTLRESKIEMAVPRFAEAPDSRAAMLEMLSVVSRLRAEFGNGITAILATGSGFPSVIGGSNPTFDTTGVAKRQAVALMEEAPSGFCGSTANATKLLHTYAAGSEEQVERHLAAANLGIDPSVSWRVRGLGYVPMVSWRLKQREKRID